MNDYREKRHRKKYFKLTDRIKSPLDLYGHLPFQIAVTSNLLQLSKDVVIRDIVELEPRELRVILNVGSYMPITAADIAYQTRLDSYTITRAVKKLQSLKLIEREVDLSNRKSKLLVLTTEGVEVYAKLCEQIKVRETVIESCLSEKEKTILMSLLSKIEDNTELLLANNAARKQQNEQVVSADQKEIMRWHKKTNRT